MSVQQRLRVLAAKKPVKKFSKAPAKSAPKTAGPKLSPLGEKIVAVLQEAGFDAPKHLAFDSWVLSIKNPITAPVVQQVNNGLRQLGLQWSGTRTTYSWFKRDPNYVVSFGRKDAGDYANLIDGRTV